MAAWVELPASSVYVCLCVYIMCVHVYARAQWSMCEQTRDKILIKYRLCSREYVTLYVKGSLEAIGQMDGWKGCLTFLFLGVVHCEMTGK